MFTFLPVVWLTYLTLIISQEFILWGRARELVDAE
jgi:hypothetical protein